MINLKDCIIAILSALLLGVIYIFERRIQLNNDYLQEVTSNLVHENKQLEIRLMEKIDTGYAVAFHTRMSKHLQNLAAGDQVVFDTVDLNEGGCYNVKDGTFTAPYNGLYAFHWTILAGAHKSFLTELVVDNIMKGRNHAHAPGYSYNLSASEMVIVYMKKDQKAWLRVWGNYGQFLFGEDSWSSFKGYLVRSYKDIGH